MPSTFSFPPPPPPPPKAAQAFPDGDSAYPRHDRGRGGRGGRGNFRVRGSSSHRGDFQQGPPNDRPYNGLPAGAYINPAFATQAQVSSSSSSGYGIATGANSSPRPEYVPGQKRKRMQPEPNPGYSQPSEIRSHPMKHPVNLPKAVVAPAVPSFGAPLPLPTKAPLPQSLATTKPAVQRSTNKLGLTPWKEASPDESYGEEEDLDEEAAFAGQAADSYVPHVKNHDDF